MKITDQTDIIIADMEKIIADAKAGKIVFTSYRQSDVTDFGGFKICRTGEVEWSVVDS